MALDARVALVGVPRRGLGYDGGLLRAYLSFVRVSAQRRCASDSFGSIFIKAPCNEPFPREDAGFFGLFAGWVDSVEESEVVIYRSFLVVDVRHGVVDECVVLREAVGLAVEVVQHALALAFGKFGAVPSGYHDELPVLREPRRADSAHRRVPFAGKRLRDAARAVGVLLHVGQDRVGAVNLRRVEPHDRRVLGEDRQEIPRFRHFVRRSDAGNVSRVLQRGFLCRVERGLGGGHGLFRARQAARSLGSLSRRARIASRRVLCLGRLVARLGGWMRSCGFYAASCAILRGFRL